MNEPGPGVLVAITVMAIATYAMRAAGFWLMQHVAMTVRMRRMLEALPGSVVVATVLPIAVREGPVAMLAIAAAGAVMILFRKDLLAVLTGMAVAAAARAAGF
ncbi:MAG TPA: AzlD domain-containing protein [Xanthobacteraceae bacterium]|jgi:uncharacterized membrane protein|nr:AzlD domain-containing protein [Xanthobacteraceae bacterium]